MRTKLQNIMPLIAAFTLVTAASAFGHNPNGKVDAMNASLEPLKGPEFEQSFLQQMIQHHRSAVEMAEQVEKKAIHPELKEFAAKIAKDQQQEIKQMKTWAQSWFGPV